MAWEGGEIPVVTVEPGPSVGQTAQTATAGTYQQQNQKTLLNQVFQGAGQTFATAAGQAVGLTGTGTAVQIAVSNAVSNAVEGLGSGFDLTKGFNLAATSLVSSIPGVVASSINQSIADSLASAGPFAPLLTTVATNLTQSLVGVAVNGILGNGQEVSGLLGGASINPGGTNYKSFPGAGQNESPANYGEDGAYTLGPNGADVVFSIRPAGSATRSTGSPLGEDPKTSTTMPTDQKTAIPGATSSGGKVADKLKTDSMDEGNILGGSNAEQDAALKRSLDRQDRGAYGKEFRRRPGSPGFRSEGDLW